MNYEILVAYLASFGENPLSADDRASAEAALKAAHNHLFELHCELEEARDYPDGDVVSAQLAEEEFEELLLKLEALVHPEKAQIIPAPDAHIDYDILASAIMSNRCAERAARAVLRVNEKIAQWLDLFEQAHANDPRYNEQGQRIAYIEYKEARYNGEGRFSSLGGYDAESVELDDAVMAWVTIARRPVRQGSWSVRRGDPKAAEITIRSCRFGPSATSEWLPGELAGKLYNRNEAQSVWDDLIRADGAERAAAKKAAAEKAAEAANNPWAALAALKKRINENEQ